MNEGEPPHDPAVAPRPIRFGTLGAAAITPAALLEPARMVPGVSVDAVAARNAQRARAFAGKHGIDRVLDTYQDILDDPELDAVYIPLPNGLHGVWAERALAADKHVLCEKPITADAAEAAGVAEAADRSGRVCMEAFHWRYHPMSQRMLDLVASGELGEIRAIGASFCVPMLKPHDIRWQLDLAGGALMDLGCYCVNIVRAVGHAAGLGEPKVERAKAKVAGPRWGGGGVDRSLQGLLRFDNGTIGAISCSMLSPRALSIALHVKAEHGTIRVFNPVVPHRFGRLSWRVDGRRGTEPASPVPSYVFQLRAFAEAVRDGAPFPSTAADGVRNMAVIDALYEAAGQDPRRPTAP